MNDIANIYEWCVSEKVLCLEGIVKPKTIVGTAMVAMDDVTDPEFLTGYIGEMMTVISEGCFYGAFNYISASGNGRNIRRGIAAIAGCYFHQIYLAIFVNTGFYIIGIGLHIQQSDEAL